jgi:hypothetical protein
MSLPLIELGQEWLLPGLANVPLESVAALDPNWPFIEAYMAGLNHEMSRELLWRGYPTDQRGTIFRRFWDRRGAVPRPGAAGRPEDIDRIHKWEDEVPLGGHGVRQGGNSLVLLVRGELLRRYPRATVFLQRARIVVDEANTPRRRPDGEVEREPVQGISDTNTRFPAFSGRLQPDLTFVGFDNVNDPKGDGEKPGWFVAFQEQPTEPRFGLAEKTTTGTTPWSWRDLSWEDVATTPGGYLDIDATSKAAVHDGERPAALNLSPQWDGRSDSLAAITMNPAFRLFIHASDLLP